MAAPVSPLLPALEKADFLRIYQQTLAHNLNLHISDESLEKVELNVAISQSVSSGGFLGDYYRIQLNVEGDVTELPLSIIDTKFHYFAKTLPTNDEVQLEVMRSTGIAARESHVYSELLPRLDVNAYPRNWSPKCYYNNNEMLIFEDLVVAGYDLLPTSQTFDDAHLREALRTLGRMHASGIVLEEQWSKSIDELNALFGPFKKERNFVPHNTWYVCGMKTAVTLAQGVPNFARRFGDKFSAEHLLEQLYSLQKTMDSADNLRNVFSHRDLWGNNIMFKYADANRHQPEHAVLVDFQLCRYMPPAMDLLQFLYLSTRRSQRDANLEQYLRFYHQALASELTAAGLKADDLLPWSELLATYEQFKMYGLVCNVLYSPLIRIPGDGFSVMRREDPSRFVRLSHVRRDDYFAEIMAEHPTYNEWITEALEELLEYVYGDGDAN